MTVYDYKFKFGKEWVIRQIWTKFFRRITILTNFIAHRCDTLTTLYNSLVSCYQNKNGKIYEAGVCLPFAGRDVDNLRLALVSEFSLFNLSIFSGFFEAAETVSCNRCSNRSLCASKFRSKIRFTGDGSLLDKVF